MKKSLKMFILMIVVLLTVAGCSESELADSKEAISSNVSIDDLYNSMKEIDSNYFLSWDLNLEETNDGYEFNTNEFFNTKFFGSTDANQMIKTLTVIQNNKFELKDEKNLTNEELVENANYLKVILARLRVADLIYGNNASESLDKEPRIGERSVRNGWERYVEKKNGEIFLYYRFIGEENDNGKYEQSGKKIDKRKITKFSEEQIGDVMYCIPENWEKTEFSDSESATQCTYYPEGKKEINDLAIDVLLTKADNTIHSYEESEEYMDIYMNTLYTDEYGYIGKYDKEDRFKSPARHGEYTMEFTMDEKYQGIIATIDIYSILINEDEVLSISYWAGPGREDDYREEFEEVLNSIEYPEFPYPARK